MYTVENCGGGGGGGGGGGRTTKTLVGVPFEQIRLLCAFAAFL
jgi:hypothetical protein